MQRLKKSVGILPQLPASAAAAHQGAVFADKRIYPLRRIRAAVLPGKPVEYHPLDGLVRRQRLAGTPLEHGDALPLGIHEGANLFLRGRCRVRSTLPGGVCVLPLRNVYRGIEIVELLGRKVKLLGKYGLKAQHLAACFKKLHVGESAAVAVDVACQPPVGIHSQHSGDFPAALSEQPAQPQRTAHTQVGIVHRYQHVGIGLL